MFLEEDLKLVERPFDEADNDWIENWLKQDFSWENLDESDRVQIVKFSGCESEDQLRGRNLVIDCGIYGSFHVFHIPTRWVTEIDDFPVSINELEEKKRAFWEAIENQPSPSLDKLIRGATFPKSLSYNLLGNIKTQNFEYVCFDGEVGLGRNNYKPVFSNCLFSDDVTFAGLDDDPGSRPKSFKFRDCVFRSNLSISQCSLEKTSLSAERCHFADHLTIFSTRLVGFDVERCNIKSIHLSESQLSGRCTVSTCQLEQFSFDDVQIRKTVLLIDTQVRKLFSVEECEFQDRFSVENCVWPEINKRSVSADSSVFQKPCSLGAVAFVDMEYGASDPVPVRFFSNAEFRSSVIIDGPISESDWDEQFKKELKVENRLHPENVDPDRYLETLENGCRKLAALAFERGDEHERFLWNRNSLKVRLERKRGSKVERFISALYGVTADFGYSILRPFYWLIGITTTMGVLYSLFVTGIDIRARIDWDIFATGLSYSASRTVPFSIFDSYLDVEIRSGIVGELPADGWIGFLKRLTAYVHTTASLVLLYILVMTIRRKFLLK